MSHPTTFDCGAAKPKGILKNANDPPLSTSETAANDALNKSVKVHWDEEGLLEEEVKRSERVKDPRMEEEKKLLTPFIRYDPSTEFDDQMETLRLSPGISSRSSSTASSPKRVQVVAMDDWPDSDEDADLKRIVAEHESFRKLRDRHYGGEGNVLRRDANNMDSSSSDEEMDQRDGADQQFRGVRIPPPVPAIPSSVATIPQPMPAIANGVPIPNGGSPRRSTARVTQGFKETYGVEDASMSDKEL
ncbi:hypothetical protein H4R20_005477 [Coemansia guatemalensis]|uniref:Uncharacterized protein n=1 Tax=Coemansia guatemalensis TaxID=2761395 RepID=A0A9W8LQR8_9FUNG|nr:hypothetical protein H4R20_005477 [Coemansia guatemalensis]